MTKLFCSCSEFRDNIEEIDDAVNFFREHSIEHNAAPFKFCPWCGKELEKEIILTCDLIIADQPTVNNRIYSKEIMLEIIDGFNKNEYKLGELSQNTDEISSRKDVRLEFVSHKCKNLRINSDGKFEAEIEPVGPQAKILKELNKNNKDQLQLFPRIIGVVDKNNQIAEITAVVSFDIINK